MAGEVSLVVEDGALQRFVPGFLRRARLIPAALRQSTRERATTLQEHLRAATPYRSEDDGPHARDGWGIDDRGEDTAIVNHVDHTYFLLHGNHPNDADGLIHPVRAQMLHFYDGGTEVFAHGVRPMHADAGLVAAWEGAQHDAHSWEHQVAERVAAALR